MMRVLYQLSICVCMVILVGGSISYVHDNPSFGGGALLIMLWGCLIGLIALLVSETQVFNFGADNRSKEDPYATERITQLEKRLTDIQDIVITIDDKLSRAERKVNASLTDGEKVTQ